MFGGVETELVAEVVVPVAGLAETVAPVAVRVVPVAVVEVAGVAFEVVAPETVAEIDEGTPFEVPVGAVCAGTTDV